MGWETSDRASQLPSNWAELRRLVFERDNRTCQNCGDPGTEVDHIIPGFDDDLSNLQLLCGRGTPRNCHAAKTQHEANAARPRERRTREQHPGLR